MGYVTFENKGRLGNYLFECAAALSYAIDHRLHFTIPFPKKSTYWNPIYFNHLYRNQGMADDTVYIREDENKFFEYKELPYSKKWENSKIVLDGYFQSEHYFKHNLEEILELWKIDIRVKRGTVGVHVRRGDYHNYPDKHILITKSWIENAMSLLPGNEFIFFSDDPTFIKSNFPSYKMSKGDVWTDFLALASCEHHIISPSTFGWFAAYINPNPNQIVIITEHWFQPTFKDNGDAIIPTNWIKLPLCV